jgi:iron complex outermembrane receptor protein
MLGVHPVRAPRHKIISMGDLTLPRNIHVLSTVRYESGTITVNDSGAVVPASKFATADIAFIVPLGNGTRLQTGVNNIFDRNYYFQEGFPEPGRNWHFGMRYHF